MYPSCNLNIIFLRVELIDVLEKDECRKEIWLKCFVKKYGILKCIFTLNIQCSFFLWSSFEASKRKYVAATTECVNLLGIWYFHSISSHKNLLKVKKHSSGILFPKILMFLTWLCMNYGLGDLLSSSRRHLFLKLNNISFTHCDRSIVQLGRNILMTMKRSFYCKFFRTATTYANNCQL